MVRKIQNGEYLKRVDNMTAAERSDYMSRVGGWLSVDGQSLVKKGEVFEARLQNVLQLSVGWNDQECAAFEEGAVLLSALVGVADTRLPELLYAISAKRAIKRMFQLLWEAEEQDNPQTLPLMEGSGYVQTPGLSDLKSGKRILASHSVASEQVRATNADTHSDGIANPAERSVRMQAAAAKETLLFADDANAGVPVRPKHFDQYAHLLPVKTQERIAKYGPLMDELDVSREKLRLLMNDTAATASDREAWAKKVAKIDKEIGAIRQEADAEWEKVVQSGRVVVDDLGMARIVSPTPDPIPADVPTSSLSPEGAGSADTPLGDGGLSSEEKARRRSIRKWLTDTRNGKGEQREKHVWKWKENFREYLTIEGDKAFEDEKIIAAAEHYGIDFASLRETKADSQSA